MNEIEGRRGGDGAESGTIFVEIAAYRDMELRDTVESALAGAEWPEKLRFGIVQQCGEEDWGLLEGYLDDGRFRIVRMDWRDCRGVGWARSLTESLYGGEDFVLQIDAHMAFDRGWDRVLKEQWRQCGDERAILSAYPAVYRRDEAGRRLLERVEWGRRVEAEVEMMEDLTAVRTLKVEVVEVPRRLWGVPRRTLYVAGGMEFFPGRVLGEVRYVREVAFHGEELVRSAQFYTYGYNVYAPAGVPIYHHYGREGRRFWEDMTGELSGGERARERDGGLVLGCGGLVPGGGEDLREVYEEVEAESERARKAILRGEDGRYLGRERSLRSFLEMLGR